MITTPVLQGYYSGMMHKTAAVPAAAIANAAGLFAIGGGKLINKVHDYAMPIFLGGPAALGLAAGTLHSKLTSPTPLDHDNMQQALLAAELEEFAANVKRKQQLAKQEDMNKQKLLSAPPRSIRI